MRKVIDSTGDSPEELVCLTRKKENFCWLNKQRDFLLVRKVYVRDCSQMESVLNEKTQKALGIETSKDFKLNVIQINFKLF